MTPQISPRTVVEAFLPPAGDVPLAVVYDTANLAGLADQPVRLAIRRLVASGDVDQAGRGRAGTLSLTSTGRRRLQRDRESLTLARAQDAGDAPWDGHWRLMAVTTPERERAVRDTLRRGLHELGAVAISTGLYVSPHDLGSELTGDARPYLSTATTSDLDVRGATSPTVIAEMLWPSGPTIAAYATLDEALRRDASDPEVPVVVRMLLLADALEVAIRDDPLLPLELRGAPWAPSQTRTTWADRWETLSKESATPVYRGWWPPAAQA
ncbi:PaaX family transcriptional regulator [Sanguibacter sp. 4.1]|uniref:PaaX family transcriptional regulator n=1 Tax=Sanguibacter biliveldensis TaxID=3030830 RepID=A0AAF1C588_9MICO|nr:PaaX family transcriptional regulator [Sanguibacter sp. 4.1]WPF83928.1 PaaX family transcriptional regulator [Sanguibacter sp. 4.1]